MQNYQIFSGLKVLELASVLAGPATGQFFAELGASVLKVENPATGGDVTRSWKLPEEGPGDVSAYFTSVNWGKKSVALDIASPEGREKIHELAGEFDVVIVSYKPGDAEKLGVDQQTLRRLNPRLVYGQVTGYGPDTEKVGYDAVIQAEAGFMYMNGQPGGESLKMPVALIDLLAAHQLKEGLLLALYRRLQTGEGAYVSVSLFDAAVASLANQAANYLVAGKIPQKAGSGHPNIVPYGTLYKTADQRELILAIGTDRQFALLCGVLGIPGTASDPRFATNPARVRNRAEVNEILGRQVAQYNLDFLLEELEMKKVPAGSINNMEQVMAAPQAAALKIEAGGVQGVRTFVARFNGELPPAELVPPPALGA